MSGKATLKSSRAAWAAVTSEGIVAASEVKPRSAERAESLGVRLGAALGGGLRVGARGRRVLLGLRSRVLCDEAEGPDDDQEDEGDDEPDGAQRAAPRRAEIEEKVFVRMWMNDGPGGLRRRGRAGGSGVGGGCVPGERRARGAPRSAAGTDGATSPARQRRGDGSSVGGGLGDRRGPSRPAGGAAGGAGRASGDNRAGPAGQACTAGRRGRQRIRRDPGNPGAGREPP